MDDFSTSEYLRKIIGEFSFGNRMLVWEAFRFFIPFYYVCLLIFLRCHISAMTKEELRRLNLDSAIIPGGCTKFVQAADVSWNSPFKAKVF